MPRGARQPVTGWVVLGTALLIAAPLRAPLHAQAASVDSVRRVVPGDTALRGARLMPGEVVYELTMYRDADEIPVGRVTEAFRVDTLQGTPVGRRVQRIRRGTTELVDTTWIDLQTLAPRARRAAQQTRRLLLEYRGRRVTGSLAPYDAPPVPLDTTLAVPAFEAGSWDLVLRALTLAIGRQHRFIVYDPDVGLREYRVAVRGQATVQGEEAFVVILTLARNRESVVWVSTVSGQILQIETLLGETTLLRQVRVVR